MDRRLVWNRFQRRGEVTMPPTLREEHQIERGQALQKDANDLLREHTEALRTVRATIEGLNDTLARLVALFETGYAIEQATKDERLAQALANEQEAARSGRRAAEMLARMEELSGKRPTGRDT